MSDRKTHKKQAQAADNQANSLANATIPKPDRTAVLQAQVNIGNAVHIFRGGDIVRPDTYTNSKVEDLRQYRFGTPSLTVPLLYKEKVDAPPTTKIIRAIQKDTFDCTIYFISANDFTSVLRAYDQTNEAVNDNNAAFYLKSKRIAFIKLPDRIEHRINSSFDGTLMLTKAEFKYLAGLASATHTHSKQLGDYAAYIEFFRKNNPQEKNETQNDYDKRLDLKLLAHILKSYQDGSIPLHEALPLLKRISNNIGKQDFDDLLQKNVDRISEEGVEEKPIMRMRNLKQLVEVFDLNTITITINKIDKNQVANRFKRGFDPARIKLAIKNGMLGKDIPGQGDLLRAICNSAAFTNEVKANAPIPIPDNAKPVITIAKLGYVQVAWRWDANIVDQFGNNINVQYEVRFHSRTQTKKNELTNYRVSITDTDTKKSYEMTPFSVSAQARNFGICFVRHGNGVLLINNRIVLTSDNQPTILCIDNQVFIHSVHPTNSKGDRCMEFPTAGGVLISYLKEKIKDSIHMTYIPRSIDYSGQ